MIKNSDRGEYTITKGLDGKIFLSLISQNNPHQKRTYGFNSQPRDNEVSRDGSYRIYEIINEIHLSNGFHVELIRARVKLQGYLILKDCTLVLTKELITRCSCSDNYDTK